MPLLNEGKSPEELRFQRDWIELRRIVKSRFGKRPDINALLFLIGMNEVGFVRDEWTKEEKQDLMHVAICKLFEEDGYFKFLGRDEEGWPHYDAMVSIPKGKLLQQERQLKERIIDYCREMKLIE
jgi:hypothetical protein